MSIKNTIVKLQKFFETKKKNLISLLNDSPVDRELKAIKVGNKITIVELSETELKVRGTINADAINVNGSPVQTGTGSSVSALNDLSDVTYSSGDLTISSLDKLITSGDLTFEIGGDAQANLSGGDWRWFYQAGGGPYEMVSIGYESSVGCYLKMAHILDPDDDFFKISHSASDRQTTISTDSDDAGGNTSHLNFDIKGNIIFDPASGFVGFSKDGTQFIQLDMNTSNTAKFQTDTNYNLTFESQGNGNMTFDSGGEVFLEPKNGGIKIKEDSDKVSETAGYGQLWVKDSSPNELCFTDDDDTDVFGIGKYHYETKVIGYFAGQTTSILPITGYIFERTSSTGANEFVGFLAPYNCRLEKFCFRSEIAQNGTLTLRVNEAQDGTEVPGTQIFRKDYTINIADDTFLDLDMTSPGAGSAYAPMTKGRLYFFMITTPSNSLDTNVTLVFRHDITT